MNLVQTTDTIGKRIGRIMVSNPNFRLSALFRKLRKRTDLQYIGDYPILSELVSHTSYKGRILKRFEILRALNNSEELSQLSKREKTTLLNQLENQSQESRNQSEIAKNKLKQKGGTKRDSNEK